MGRVLAKTIAVYDEKQGKSVTYLAGAEVPDEVAAGITNESVFEESVDDTTDADKAAAARAREAYDAGRPLHELDEDEVRAWAYDPDLETEDGKAAEAKLVEAEGGSSDDGSGSDDGAGAGDGSGSDDGSGDGGDGSGDGAGAGDQGSTSDVPEPPRSGKGSGVQAWRAYAEAKGFTVPAEADRDGIVAIVDAAKQ